MKINTQQKHMTLDDLTAAIERAGEPKAEAIANADAHTSDAGLPTYSELVEALNEGLPYINADPNDPHGPVYKIVTLLGRVPT